MGSDDTLLLLAGAALVFYYFMQQTQGQASGEGITVEPMGSPDAWSPAWSPTPTSSPAPSMVTDYPSSFATPFNVSPQGRAFIEGQEALRLQTYPDAGGLAIGYGHRLQPGESYPNGITVDQADALFAADLAHVEQTINADVSAPLTQEQYDALASLIYNIGAGAFASSTLLADLNAGDYAAAAAQFPAWNRSGGQVSPVLVARRSQEAAIFSSGLIA